MDTLTPKKSRDASPRRVLVFPNGFSISERTYTNRKLSKVTIKSTSSGPSDPCHPLRGTDTAKYRFSAFVVYAKGKTSKKINFGERGWFYKADGDVVEDESNQLHRMKTSEERKYKSIERDSRDIVRNRNWWTCWLLKQRTSIREASKVVEEYVGCKVEIDEKVLWDLGGTTAGSPRARRAGGKR